MEITSDAGGGLLHRVSLTHAERPLPYSGEVAGQEGAVHSGDPTATRGAVSDQGENHVVFFFFLTSEEGRTFRKLFNIYIK